MCFSHSIIHIIKYGMVILEIVEIIKLKKSQKVMSCMMTCVLNYLTSLPLNFIYNCMFQPLKAIPALQ